MTTNIASGPRDFDNDNAPTPEQEQKIDLKPLEIIPTVTSVIETNSTNGTSNVSGYDNRYRSSSLTRPPKLPCGRRHDEVFNPRKLYVGNLSKDMSNRRFREFWETFGTLEDCIVIKESTSNESRGFGFVVFSDQEAMEKVLKLAETLEIDGRKLDIRKAVPRVGGRYRGGQTFNALLHTGTEAETEAGTQGHFANSHGTARESRVTNKLFVGSLPENVKAEQLSEEFKKFGNITDSVVMYDSEGRSRRFGFVTFEDPRNCDRALRSGPYYIGDTRIIIERAVPKREIDMYRMEEEAHGYGSNYYRKYDVTPAYYSSAVDGTPLTNTSGYAHANLTYTSVPMNVGTVGFNGTYGYSDPAYYAPYYDVSTMQAAAYGPYRAPGQTYHPNFTPY